PTFTVSNRGKSQHLPVESPRCSPLCERSPRMYGLRTLALVITLGLFGAHLLHAADVIDPTTAKADPDGQTLWYDIQPLGVEGKAGQDPKASYDRLPGKAEGVVRDPVWKLSRHATGMCVRFVSDAPTIQARWTLTGENLAMPHMPATGVSGLDLYIRDK